MGALNGQIMEISGLGLEPPAQKIRDMMTLYRPPTTWEIILALGIPIFVIGAVRMLAMSRGRKMMFLDGVSLGDLGIIKKCAAKDLKDDRPKAAQKWCLMDSKGKRVLGRHRSRGGAVRQERLIQMKKHARHVRRKRKDRDD